MSDPADQPTPPEPRHPFTYRAPAQDDEETPDAPAVSGEESRRNDTVLVIAALLMGIMFAWTTLADPRALVHLKTGNYLASHGFWPPQTDVFSATAQGQPWINLSWLGDLFLAGVHAIGGMIALTVVQVVCGFALLGLIFACHRRGVSAWWASLVMVLAAVAAMPHLRAQPVLFTLVGVALTLWLLTRYRRDADNSALWWLVPLFLVWSNVDPRMFLGLAILLLYGVGELVGAAIGRPGFEDNPRRYRYWTATGGCVLASMVNPFTWRAPLAAVTLYGRIDPAFREHYAGAPTWRTLCHMRVFDQPLAMWLDTALLAGLLMALISLVTLVLNRRRTEPGDVCVWLGFVGFGVLAGREWPAAAIVFAVLAIRNAEDWYHHGFRDSVSNDRGELLFSRGGRSLTVLAFFALAALWLTGRVIPEDGRRPGQGLDPALANQLSSLSNLLADSYDTKVFNFHAGQGDQLIWLGYQPFIDHRLALYAEPGSDGSPDLLTQHARVSRALHTIEGEERRVAHTQELHAILGEYQIVQVLPRLVFPHPHYDVYFEMLGRPEWRLARLDAAGAMFYHVEANDTELQAFLRTHRINFAREAFRDVERIPGPLNWPSQRTWAEKIVNQGPFFRRSPIPNRLARARHIAEHYERMKAGELRLAQPLAIAMSYVGIRDCYTALAKGGQDVHAYRCLGLLFEMLYVNEQQLVDVPIHRRLYQAVGAYGQALAIKPDNPHVHEDLVGIYLAFNRLDLAVRSRERYETLTGKPFPDPANPAAAKEIAQVWERVDATIQQVTEQVDTALENGQSRLEVATFAWQNGCTVLALATLEGEPQLAETNPAATLLKARCLLEAAQPMQALVLLSRIEQSAAQMGGWREPLALTYLTVAGFERAGELFQEAAEHAAEARLMAAMQAIPIGGSVSGFPVLQTTRIRQVLSGATRRIANHKLDAALCALDAGNIPEAEEELAALLDEHPLTIFTSLAGFYLGEIRNTPITIDLGGPPEDDRFTEIAEDLNSEMISRRVDAAGPVTAPKPAN